MVDAITTRYVLRWDDFARMKDVKIERQYFELNFFPYISVGIAWIYAHLRYLAGDFGDFQAAR